MSETIKLPEARAMFNRLFYNMNLRAPQYNLSTHETTLTMCHHDDTKTEAWQIVLDHELTVKEFRQYNHWRKMYYPNSKPDQIYIVVL